MKTIFSICSIILTIFLVHCEETEFNIPKPQYIITGFFANTPEDFNWFNVINIRTKQTQLVPAVKELEGNYYLPFTSRMPTFWNKVVEGEFYIDQPEGLSKPDTLFKVTNHLRDTTITN